jgi:hypothetical protein
MCIKTFVSLNITGYTGPCLKSCFKFIYLNPRVLKQSARNLKGHSNAFLSENCFMCTVINPGLGQENVNYISCIKLRLVSAQYQIEIFGGFLQK